MTQMHMLTAAIIWFIQLIVIAFSLFYALDKYYRTTRSSRSQEDEGVGKQIFFDDSQLNLSHCLLQFKESVSL